MSVQTECQTFSLNIARTSLSLASRQLLALTFSKRARALADAFFFTLWGRSGLYTRTQNTWPPPPRIKLLR